jgi:lipopolysaccharide transport system permease protein
VRHRALIASLVSRDVRARYRGSFLGYFWTLLNPLLLLIVYRLVFTQLTRAVEMKNYALFFFCGILPWMWLATSVTTGTVAISQGGALITRVCMPPQVLPAVIVLSNFVNFLLALPVAVAAAVYYGHTPSAALAAVPLAMISQLVFVYGVALTLASLTVRFRDVQFLVQNLIMVWFFLTPIAYPIRQVPAAFQPYLVANPATSIVLPYQTAIFEQVFPSAGTLAIGAAWAVAALVAGVTVFEKLRDTMAEEI